MTEHEQEQESQAARTEAEMQELADRSEAQAEGLERHTDHLAKEIESARRDWASKQADPSIPGAVSPEPEPEREEQPQEPRGGRAESGQ